MSEKFCFWIHGVNVIPEYTKEYTGHDNGLYMRRTGWGAQIRQNQDTSNWFHFAIPSATKLDDDNVSYNRAWLRLRINEHAVIDRVQIREASGPQSNCPLVWDSESLNITGQDTELTFNLPNQQHKGPLDMCVHVRFDRDNGEVVFADAGGWFEGSK